MNFEILIILFLLLSVISTVINKLQQHRRKQMDEDDRPLRRRRPPIFEPDEEDFELEDWLGNRPAKEGEELPNGHPSEFQPVHGRRTVEESFQGDEFQEVEGKRSVEEHYTGNEFRPVEGVRRVTETPSYKMPEAHTLEPLRPARTRRQRKRSNMAFDLSPKTLRKAIIYNEIIGPPRSERMPD